MPMPVVEDLLEDSRLLSPELRERYLPAGQETLANLWLNLLQLSLELETIISATYKPGRHLPQLSDTRPVAGRIAIIRRSISHTVEHTDPDVSVHAAHLKTFCK